MAQAVQVAPVLRVARQVRVVPAPQVAQAVRSANLDFPTGNFKDADEQFVVRVAGKFSSVEDLRKLVVGRTRLGGDIHLEDIAEVQDGRKDYEQINRVNGITSIGIQVVKQSDANAVSVSKLVRAELEKIQEEYKKQGIVFTIAEDSSTFCPMDTKSGFTPSLERTAAPIISPLSISLLHAPAFSSGSV